VWEGQPPRSIASRTDLQATRQAAPDYRLTALGGWVDGQLSVRQASVRGPQLRLTSTPYKTEISRPREKGRIAPPSRSLGGAVAIDQIGLGFLDTELARMTGAKMGFYRPI
jgi:hypothetical protein